MTHQVIPDAAVEAAAQALAICDGYTESSWAARANAPEYGHGYYANVARLALEAAAPHILREAKREAWEEGYTAADYDAPHAGKSANPYDLYPQPRFEASPEPRGPWTR